MSIVTLFLLLGCICAIAILYSSVGHGGASGYIATLALFSIPMTVIKPTALILNIVVATVATINFSRSGNFNWGLFWPFAISSIPLSFLGGALTLPHQWHRPLIGIILLYSAYRLFRHPPTEKKEVIRASLPASIVAGGLLGFLSGLTGVGGGIFLSPLLILMKWSDTRETSAVSAMFILVNSVAGLAGYMSGIHSLPGVAPLMAVMALVGGMVGSYLGSRMPGRTIMRALSAVLVLAGVKLLAI